MYAGGGCGTLISSLASLITFKQFCVIQFGKAGKYLLVCHGLNFAFLGVMLLCCYFPLTVRQCGVRRGRYILAAIGF